MSEPQLLIRRGALGDTILCEPIARAMGETLPDSEVHVAGVEENVALLAELGPCAKSISAEFLQLWSPDRARERLRGYCRIVCDDEALARSLRPTLPITGFDPVLDGSSTEAAAAQLLRRAGFVADHDSVPRLRFVGAPAVRHDRWLLHPGSGSPRKCWPIQRWLELAEALRNLHLEFDFLVGPVERERRPEIAELRAIAPLLEPTSTLELARLLAGARGFLGHDSGPTHLAAALGVGVVAIFVTTDPRVWAPARAEVFAGDVDVMRVAHRVSIR